MRNMEETNTTIDCNRMVDSKGIQEEQLSWRDGTKTLKEEMRNGEQKAKKNECGKSFIWN